MVKKKNIKKGKVRETIALTLALVAIAFLLINSIYILVSKEKITSEILQDPSLKEFNIENLSDIINTLMIIFVGLWFILAVALSITVYYVETKRWKWYWLLVLSVISLLFARIDTAIFGIIASILYIKR